MTQGMTVTEHPEERSFVELVVTAAQPCATDIVRFELRHPDGIALPPPAPPWLPNRRMPPERPRSWLHHP